MEQNETTQSTATEAQAVPPRHHRKPSPTMQWVYSILGTILSSLLTAFPAFSLIAPNEFTVGGISGITILLEAATGLPKSYGTLFLNAPLIILSFFFVKKKFAIMSTVNILLQVLWLTLFENFLPESFQIIFGEGAEKIFAAIAAALCFGAAFVIAFKAGGSTGGTDILAVMIQKKLAAGSIAWILFAINTAIISASFFVFYDKEATIAVNLLPVMLSVFEEFLISKIIEALNNGFQSAIEFRIITDKPEELAEALMNELSRGATSIPAKGMYTKVDHSMLVCVISRRQVAALKRIMHEVDPDAFAVMSHVSQVLGLGFYSAEH